MMYVYATWRRAPFDEWIIFNEGGKKELGISLKFFSRTAFLEGILMYNIGTRWCHAFRLNALGSFFLTQENQV